MNLDPKDFVRDKKPPTAYNLFSEEYRENKKERIKSATDQDFDSQSLKPYKFKMPAHKLNKMLQKEALSTWKAMSLSQK